MTPQPQLAPDEIKSAIARVNYIFNAEVFGKRNYSALDEVYTSGARILPPGGPIVSGREAIKAFWSGMIESVNATSAVLNSVDLMPSGDGMVEIGTATLSMKPEGTLEAKYVVYWREEEGQWKWHVDIWNTNA
jgi:ketosteroid isomerase-like protein